METLSCSGYDHSSGASDRAVYRAALEAEILLLDDLGTHRVTEWVEDTVTAKHVYDRALVEKDRNYLATPPNKGKGP